MCVDEHKFCARVCMRIMRRYAVEFMAKVVGGEATRNA